MNRDEGKYILRSYHLDGEDAEDPQFQEALEMLRHDPELGKWFAREQAIDRNISEALRAFPVPPGLKGELLAARKIVRPRAWWHRAVWVSAAAAAAVLMLLGALAVLWGREAKKRQFAEFQSFIVETAAKLDHLDVQTSDLRQIREWLSDHGAPDDFVIPSKLNGKSSVGCRVFAWNGRQVSLICFELGNNKVAHLFVMDGAGLTNLPGRAAPQIQSAGNGIATASWNDAKRIYIVALAQGAQDLKRLLL